jgi:predicted GIY-YIG superfamily endonuclease
VSHEMTLPDGFDWCGGCGTPVRRLTADEAADLIAQAHAAVVDGADPLDVLRALEWPAEMHLRSRYVLCDCPPAPPPAWWSGAPTARGYYVYRLWTADERLLYVGVSTVLRDRLKAHARADYGPLIDSFTFEECPDAAWMLRAETEAIQTEHPALNKAKVGPR